MIQDAITIQRVPLHEGGEAIALMLRADAFVELFGGEILPGVTMTLAEARVVAYRILFLAAQLEAGLNLPWK